MVLDLRSVVWGEDPIRQWILRNVVDSRFISEPTSDLEDTRPEYRIPQFIADLARRMGNPVEGERDSGLKLNTIPL
jgi:hypothetical protein